MSTPDQLKVLITSPSLDPAINLGGISSHTRKLLQYNQTQPFPIIFKHVMVGRSDKQPRNLKWILNQMMVVVKFINTANNADLIHLNVPREKYSLIIFSVLMLIANFKKVKSVLHFRGGAIQLNGRSGIFTGYLIKYLIKSADSIICQGEQEKREVLLTNSIDDSAQTSKVYVLSNCVSLPDKSNPKRFTPTDKKRRNFVFVGRLDRNKGLSELADSLSRISETTDVIFHCIGEGPDLNILSQQLHLKSGSKVIYHGKLEYTEIEKILLCSEFFLLPSYFEGLPNSLLEAMACGCIPIATAVGSIPEVIEHGVNGFLAIPKNKIEFFKAMTDALSRSDSLLVISESARQTIKANYSISEYYIKLKNIYLAI